MDVGRRAAMPRRTTCPQANHRVGGCHRHSSKFPSPSLFLLLCITDSSAHGRGEEEEAGDDSFEEVNSVEPGIPVRLGHFCVN